MTNTSGIEADSDSDSILEMVPTQAKLFFIFVIALIIFIILLTLILNQYLFIMLDRIALLCEDITEYLCRCRKVKSDDEFSQLTGKRKDRKRYWSKYGGKKDNKNTKDEDDDEEEEDEDSDDEVMMGFWKMVEKDASGDGVVKSLEEAALKKENTLKIQIGMGYQHKTGVVSCHVMKVGGLLGEGMKQEPWIRADGVFTRLLLLTKEGLLLNKEDSKAKKLSATTAGEMCYDEYFNFQIPLCQINNVILLVSLFVICSSKTKSKEGLKDKKEGGGDDGATATINFTRTPVSWISFGLNPSSKKTFDQWSLMIQHTDEVKIWHDLIQTTNF